MTQDSQNKCLGAGFRLVLKARVGGLWMILYRTPANPESWRTLATYEKRSERDSAFGSLLVDFWTIEA